MSLDQDSLENAVTARTNVSAKKAVEILNRSQQKLRDAEEELDVMQDEQGRIDADITRMKDSIAKMELLLAKEVANSADLGIAIKANLSLIDSLRKDNIRIPAPQ